MEENKFIIQVNPGSQGEEVDKDALKAMNQPLVNTSAFYPGEVVIVSTGYSREEYEVHTVKSVSKTGQVLLNNGMRFLPDGREIGGVTSYRRLRKATPVLLEEALHQKYTRYLSGVKWGLLDTDMQRSILDILYPIFRGVPRE